MQADGASTLPRWMTQTKKPAEAGWIRLYSWGKGGKRRLTAVVSYSGDSRHIYAWQSGLICDAHHVVASKPINVSVPEGIEDWLTSCSPSRV